jgi:hypothetical protein
MRSKATAAAVLVVLGLCSVAAAALQPRITGIAPERPVVSAKPQTITITGEDFRAGLTLQVTTPGGQARQLLGADIVAQKTQSFQVAFTFEEPGTYSFVVTNTDGNKSEPFPIQARRPEVQPIIDQVNPAEPMKGTQPQSVTIAGRNFSPNMRLSVTDPTGKVVVITSFDKADATTLVARVLYEHSGIYGLMVTNAAGDSSNSVTVTVR